MPESSEASAPESGEAIGSMSFEAALRELDGVVRTLESGEADLEATIAIYERGVKLRDHCEACLRRAEERIERIIVDESGKPVGAEPVHPHSDSFA